MRRLVISAFMVLAHTGPAAAALDGDFWPERFVEGRPSQSTPQSSGPIVISNSDEPVSVAADADSIGHAFESFWANTKPADKLPAAGFAAKYDPAADAQGRLAAGSAGSRSAAPRPAYQDFTGGPLESGGSITLTSQFVSRTPIEVKTPSLKQLRTAGASLPAQPGAARQPETIGAWSLGLINGPKQILPGYNTNMTFMAFGDQILRHGNLYTMEMLDFHNGPAVVSMSDMPVPFAKPLFDHVQMFQRTTFYIQPLPGSALMMATGVGAVLASYRQRTKGRGKT